MHHFVGRRFYSVKTRRVSLDVEETPQTNILVGRQKKSFYASLNDVPGLSGHRSRQYPFFFFELHLATKMKAWMWNHSIHSYGHVERLGLLFVTLKAHSRTKARWFRGKRSFEISRSHVSSVASAHYALLLMNPLASIQLVCMSGCRCVFAKSIWKEQIGEVWKHHRPLKHMRLIGTEIHSWILFRDDSFIKFFIGIKSIYEEMNVVLVLLHLNSHLIAKMLRIHFSCCFFGCDENDYG